MRFSAKLMLKAQAYGVDAVEVLRDIAVNTNSPSSARVSAAAKILELGSIMFDQEKIADRITLLERCIKIES